MIRILTAIGKGTIVGWSAPGECRETWKWPSALSAGGERLAAAV